jgi:hypothetical protein
MTKESFGGVGLVDLGVCDTDACLKPQFRTGDVEWVVENGEDPPRHVFGLILFDQVLEQDREFITAEPGERVRGPKCRSDLHGHLDQ